MSSIIDSIIFKVEFLTNGALGLVTNDMITRSTDICVDFQPNIKENWDIVDIKNRTKSIVNKYDDATGIGIVLQTYSISSASGFITYLKQSDEAKYITAKVNGSLFGLSFLPWEVPIYYDASDDTYWSKEIRYNNKLKGTLFRDPLAPDVLFARLQTIAILGTVGLISFKGFEMVANKIKKRYT